MSDYGLHIFPQHAKLLEASAISPEVARARGYVSVDTKKRLEDLGFARYQRSLPGLLVPLRRADGSVWGYQYRPDEPRVTKAGTVIKYETPKDQRNSIDVPASVKETMGDPSVPLWVTEGSRKADSAVSVGLACVSLNGVWGWRGRNARGGKLAVPAWHEIVVNGRRVILAFDSDTTRKPAVRHALAELGGYLESKGARTAYLHLPDDSDAKTGLDDYIAAEGADGLMELVRPEPPALSPAIVQSMPRGDTTHISGTPPAKPMPDVPPMTITQVENLYARWLHDEDRVTTRVCHAVYVANMVLPGDPVWVILVGGSGWGKTERIIPLGIMPHTVLASKVKTEAALLSATPRRDRAEHADGGLLRRIDAKGMLLIKDFTSVLETDRHDRGEILAALREIYDGRWDRAVGAEGGQTLTWQGKCGLIAGSTTTIDRAHAVMNDMGPRSLLLRLPAGDLDKIAASAIDHMGREQQMRDELAKATAGLLTHLPGRPHEVTGDARAGLIGLANLVSQARSPVHRDYKGEIELIADAEAPTRIVKQLGQIWRASGMLGLGQRESWELSPRARAWMDSIGTLPEMWVSRPVVARTCTVCGEPLSQEFIDAGFTDHGEDPAA